MSNILEVPHQHTIQALISNGWSVRRIARTLGINRRTVKRYAATSPKCTTQVITGSAAPGVSKCTTQVITGSAAPGEPKCTTQVTTGSRSLCGGFYDVVNSARNTQGCYFNNDNAYHKIFTTKITIIGTNTRKKIRLEDRPFMKWVVVVRYI